MFCGLSLSRGNHLITIYTLPLSVLLPPNNLEVMKAALVSYSLGRAEKFDFYLVCHTDSKLSDLQFLHLNHFMDAFYADKLVSVPTLVSYYL